MISTLLRTRTFQFWYFKLYSLKVLSIVLSTILNTRQVRFNLISNIFPLKVQSIKLGTKLKTRRVLVQKNDQNIRRDEISSLKLFLQTLVRVLEH